MPSDQRQKDEGAMRPFISDEVALVLYAALLAAWIGCLIWGSLASHLPSIPRFLVWDKLRHFLAYAILMFFSGNFFRPLCKNYQWGWRIGFIFTVGFGLLMEIAQQNLTTTRQADWKDLLANSLGALLIFVIMQLKKQKLS